MQLARTSLILSTVAVCGLAVVAWTHLSAAPTLLVQAKPLQPAPTRTSNDPPIGAKGRLGQDLFLAIDHRDLAGVQAFLKQGADPNASNGLGLSPLDIAVASHQDDVAETLLQAGAKLEANSVYGTALCFAALGGNETGIHLLLERGAKVNVVRADGDTPLMFAARSCGAGAIRELLSRKAKVNAKDNFGATALIYAAREGQPEAGKVLLDAGAYIDAIDSGQQTALMHAAMNGRAKFVKLLLERGANPNAQDAQGRTPLILTASYGNYPEVIELLKSRGADANIKDSQNRDAFSIARERGRKDVALAVYDAALLSPSPYKEAPHNPKAAIQKSLKALEASMLKFNQRTGCVSCHHEGLGRIALSVVRERGFSLNPAIQQAQTGRLNGGLNALRPLHLQALKDREAMKQVPLIEMNEVTTGNSWLLAGMAEMKQPKNEANGAMTMVLARQQSPNGAWTYSLPRVPMQSSAFTFTALSVRALRAYAPQTYAKEIAERIGRAKNWLMTTPTTNSEDRASRLLGLKWAGASAEEREKSVQDILTDQRADGGWAQLDDMQSDAYATGQALYALRAAGGAYLPDFKLKQGVQFLLRTQEEDGSWFVNKRTAPNNNYFDAGFSHGLSQYSSFNGTCWAMMALAKSLNAPKQSANATP